MNKSTAYSLHSNPNEEYTSLSNPLRPCHEAQSESASETERSSFPESPAILSTPFVYLANHGVRPEGAGLMRR
jgi:hypothetical protein